MVACAEPSLAARREASKLGIAMAAMMPMIATTIKSSINEKPSWRLVFILISCSLREIGVATFSRQRLSSLGDAAQSAKCRGSLQQPPCQDEPHPQKAENGRFYVGFEKWKGVRKVPDNLRHVGNDGLWHVTLGWSIRAV